MPACRLRRRPTLSRRAPPRRHRTGGSRALPGSSGTPRCARSTPAGGSSYARTRHVLGTIDHLEVAVAVQAARAALGAQPAPLGTAEGQRRGEGCVGVDPAEARLKALRDSRGPFGVVAPDGAAQPEHAGVRAPHGVAELRVLLDRQGRAELFL